MPLCLEPLLQMLINAETLEIINRILDGYDTIRILIGYLLFPFFYPVVYDVISGKFACPSRSSHLL